MAGVPFFSIIVPTHARPRCLATCLQSLTGLDYSAKRWEVIVVDDGSQTPAENVVAPFRSRLNVTLLTQNRAGPAAARNTGAQRAKGEFLVFTDDDRKPASNWLRSFAARFEEHPDSVIGGRTANTLGESRYCAATQLFLDYLYEYYNRKHEQARFLASNNLALSASCFHWIGGFDTTFSLAGGEDRDLCDRCLLHGYPLIYAPEALVHHNQALSFRTFCSKHFRYGQGAFRFHRLRAQRGLQRMELEPLSFYLNLIRYPYRQAGRETRTGLSSLLVLSQVANALGFLWQWVARSRS